MEMAQTTLLQLNKTAIAGELWKLKLVQLQITFVKEFKVFSWRLMKQQNNGHDLTDSQP